MFQRNRAFIPLDLLSAFVAVDAGFVRRLDTLVGPCGFAGGSLCAAHGRKSFNVIGILNLLSAAIRLMPIALL